MLVKYINLYIVYYILPKVSDCQVVRLYSFPSIYIDVRLSDHIQTYYTNIVLGMCQVAPCTGVPMIYYENNIGFVL